MIRDYLPYWIVRLLPKPYYLPTRSLPRRPRRPLF